MEEDGLAAGEREREREAEERGGALYGGEMTRERRMFAQHFGVAHRAPRRPADGQHWGRLGRVIAIVLISYMRIKRQVGDDRRVAGRGRERSLASEHDP